MHLFLHKRPLKEIIGYYPSKSIGSREITSLSEFLPRRKVHNQVQCRIDYIITSMMKSDSNIMMSLKMSD